MLYARPFRLLPLVLLLAAGALLPADQPTGPLHLQMVKSLATVPQHRWRIEHPSLVRALYDDLIDLPPAQNLFFPICQSLWPSYTLTFYRDEAVLLNATWGKSCGDPTLHLENGLRLVPDQRFVTLLDQAISVGVSRAPPLSPGCCVPWPGA